MTSVGRLSPEPTVRRPGSSRQPLAAGKCHPALSAWCRQNEIHENACAGGAGMWRAAGDLPHAYAAAINPAWTIVPSPVMPAAQRRMRHLPRPRHGEIPTRRQDRPAMAANLVGRDAARSPIPPRPPHDCRHRTPERPASARQVTPSSTAATTCTRRSFERGRVMQAGRQSQRPA